MDAVILSVGTELVIGQCVDTNSAWLAAELTHLGVIVIRHETVGDDPIALRSSIRAARDRADLVVITGGLGPTPDDLTRAAIADALGVPLREDPDALKTLHALFARAQRSMPDSNRVQALVPDGCDLLSNPRGTAPGLSCRNGAKWLVALPGVPAEMRVMFDASVRRGIRGTTGTASVAEVRLLCYGISEARLAESLADLMTRGRNPSVGTTASDAVLSVRIVAHGSDTETARALANVDAREVRQRLGNAVFGVDDATLGSTVGAALSRTGQTVSVAESCTGGMLAACLTEIPGSSAYFLRGYVTYANRAKIEVLGVDPAVLEEHGAVSEPVAAAMATGCRDAAGSDFALSVTGVAGPDGGSPDKPVGTVFIGLARRDGVDVKRIPFSEHLTRSEIRDRSCKSALNILRLELLK